MGFEWKLVEQLEAGELFLINCCTQVVQFTKITDVLDTQNGFQYWVSCFHADRAIEISIDVIRVLTFQSACVGDDLSYLLRAKSLQAGQSILIPGITPLSAHAQGVIATVQHEIRRPAGYEFTISHINLTNGYKASIHGSQMVEILSSPAPDVTAPRPQARGHLYTEMWF